MRKILTLVTLFVIANPCSAGQRLRAHALNLTAKPGIERFYPEGNGLFILYYGGSIESGTTPTKDTLETMKRLWEVQPNFVVVAQEFQGSSEIVNIFHHTDSNHKAVKVLAYVIMTDEPCQVLRSGEVVDSETSLAIKTGYDGIFFDCTKDNPESYPNIHQWNTARVAGVKKDGNKLVIMNPGEAYVDSRVFDYADIVCVENQYDKRPTAFIRQKGIAPEKSQKRIVAQWRWLAVQGQPSNKAATSSKVALERLVTFRQNGGFWYYSPPFKKGKNEATHIILADWLEDFSSRVKQMESCPCKADAALQKELKVLPVNGIYHGAFPEFSETEDQVTPEAIRDLEAAVGKPIAWAYFSNNWFIEDSKGKAIAQIKFPGEAVRTIWGYRTEHRIVPFIRMMPRSSWSKKKPDPVYTMQKIIDGEFDVSLRAWAREARDARVSTAPEIRIPLMIEFGAEVNGDWFAWNGRYNGGSQTKKYGDPTRADGPERYRDAYRHIIDLFRSEDATNVTWVFHVDAHRSPDELWNNMAGYFPGDDYIDWIGAIFCAPPRPPLPPQQPPPLLLPPPPL